jgi:hypothetical protein
MTTQPKDKVQAALDRLAKKHGLTELWAVYQSEESELYHGPGDAVTDEAIALLGKCLGWVVVYTPFLALKVAADAVMAIARFRRRRPQGRAEERGLRDALNQPGEALPPKADGEAEGKA